VAAAAAAATTTAAATAAEASASAAPAAAATATVVDAAASPSPPPAAVPEYVGTAAAAEIRAGQPVRVLWTAGFGGEDDDCYECYNLDHDDGGAWRRGTVHAVTAGVRVLVIDFDRSSDFPRHCFVEFAQQGATWKLDGPVLSPPPSPPYRPVPARKTTTPVWRYCQVCESETTGAETTKCALCLRYGAGDASMPPLPPPPPPPCRVLFNSAPNDSTYMHCPLLSPPPAAAAAHKTCIEAVNGVLMYGGEPWAERLPFCCPSCDKTREEPAPVARGGSDRSRSRSRSNSRDRRSVPPTDEAAELQTMAECVRPLQPLPPPQPVRTRLLAPFSGALSHLPAAVLRHLLQSARRERAPGSCAAAGAGGAR
jgi:hypothetical protein